MNRRDFLKQSITAAAALPAVTVLRGTSSSEQRIAQVIRAYDQQGIHRTGTAVDQRSAKWLAETMRRWGVMPAIEPFALSRVDPLTSRLQVGGKRITGLPVFDGGFTTAAGVSGSIGPLGSGAAIGLAEAPPNAEYGPTYQKMRQASDHRAIVLVTRGTRPGLSPINASKFTQPYGPPILQVSSEESDWLKQQAERRAEATLVLHVNRTNVQAYNVTAKITGSDSRLAPLVVMTPRSGWWQCASERGGGLCCWLEAMRVLATSKPARDVWFIASSGHELGHLGLEAFIEGHPGIVKSAYVWMHFGANIGAAQEPGHRLQASTEEFEKLAFESMKSAGTKVDEVAPRNAAPFGEAGNIHRRGGHYLSLLGRNALFHHPADRWPAAVDVASIARYASAFADVMLRLAKQTVGST